MLTYLEEADEEEFIIVECKTYSESLVSGEISCSDGHQLESGHGEPTTTYQTL